MNAVNFARKSMVFGVICEKITMKKGRNFTIKKDYFCLINSVLSVLFW